MNLSELNLDPNGLGGEKQPANPAASYSKYIVRGFIALFLLVIGLGGWAATAPINGAVIASGTIVVEGKPKTLQHLDGGIIREILVKNGSEVSPGDIVLRLDPTEMDANKAIVEKRLFLAQARSDRLKSARDARPKIIWSKRLQDVSTEPEIAELLAGQKRLFNARRKSFEGQNGQLRQRIAQSNEQIRGFDELLVSKNVQLRLVSEEWNNLKTLLADGYVSKTRVLELERENARLSGEIASHRSDIARIRSQVSEIQIQILQLAEDRNAEILTELREVEAELNDLREQFTTAAEKSEHIEIITPVAGIVHDLSVTTIGGVISPGEHLMQIIPINDRLIIESRVLPTDIDQIYDGQSATIRMSGFNQRTTSELNGSVIKASANSLVDEATGLPYFNVLIEVPDEELEKLGSLTLIPGMPAEAFIQTKSRTALSYLFKPFSDHLSRTFREE